jgi:hypothetical protein
MPKMLVTHLVVDIDRWLNGKAERAASIGKYATDVTDYVAVDGSNSVAITADVHDLARLLPAMGKVAAAKGLDMSTIGGPEVTITEVHRVVH